jgi:F0F1-type ATP synthase membrane subunit a
MFIAKKIMVFLLVFAILFVAKEILNFVAELMKENGRYSPTTARLITLGAALSYIFTIIFTGFRLL